MYGFIYHLTMMRSKGYIKKAYDTYFWKRFKQSSDEVFRQVAKELPDIGESIFSFNYAYAPSYVDGIKVCRSWGLTEKRLMT